MTDSVIGNKPTEGDPMDLSRAYVPVQPGAVDPPTYAEAASAVPPPAAPAGVFDVLAGLAEWGDDSLPEPYDVQLDGRNRVVALLFDNTEAVRAWSAALHIGEPETSDEPDLGMVLTTARAIIAGWSTTLRHIQTRPAGATT